MHILNSSVFRQSLREKGYHSIEALARALKIHRNTIHYYLSGHGVFPTHLEKILEVLELSPAEILVQKKENNDPSSLDFISSVIDQLHTEFPHVTFVLFGSRVRGKSHRYSDWDIGVFSKDGLPHPLYRKMLRRKGELTEDLPFLIDLINLNRADFSFLQKASQGWKFLTGRLSDWCDLQKKVCV